MTSSPSITSRPGAGRNESGHTVTDTEAASTRRLLACGAVAGPLFVVAVVVQALTRRGFNLTRDAASLLDLGTLGWIQVTNFLATGLLTIASAVGHRRGTPDGPGSKWTPRLLTITGAGLIGGGLFHPDPSGGYPPGTLKGASAVSSWHGALHMICGSAAFLALIIVCFVIARRFRAVGQRRVAAVSRVAGALCAIGIASSGAPAGSLSLFLGVSIALVWIGAVSARLITTDRSQPVFGVAMASAGGAAVPTRDRKHRGAP